MNEKHFNQLFLVTRKNVSESWNSEPFVEFGRVRGFLQPTGGVLTTTLGRVSTTATHVLYCGIASDIQAGDIVTALDGTGFTVMASQREGISGKHDHKEIDLLVKE